MAANTQRYLFHIQGIKCTKCIAKIRTHVSKKHKEISDLKLNLAQSSLGFVANDSFSKESLKSELKELGFIANEIDLDSQEKEMQSLKERRDFLIRLGVAGACTGNSMLVSFSLYLGADQTPFKNFLSWAAFFFYLPIAFYSAYPLIKSAINSVKALRPSIDVPIVLAIIVGGLLSFYSLAIGREEFYFDSLSMLIFLILCTRFLVFTIRQNHLTPLSLTQFLDSNTAQVLTKKGELKSVALEEIKPEQTLLLKQNQSVPFDSTLLNDKADFDTSILTGESFPKTLKKYDTVFAGSKSLNKDTRVIVKTDLHSSRFSKILDSINSLINEKNELVSLTDRGAQILTYLILSVSSIFLILPIGLDVFEKTFRVLALLVIACPCALAIATPLALSLSVKNLFKNNVLVKNLEAFGLLKKTTSVIFDKTGTLTSGSIKLKKWHPRTPRDNEASIIYAMEKQSQHPLAKAILRSLHTKNLRPINLKVSEEPGVGVFSKFENHSYSLEKSKTAQSEINFKKDEKILLTASFETDLNDDSKFTIEELKTIGVDSILLTGDKKSEAVTVGKKLGLKEHNIFYEQSPEMKLETVKKLKKEHESIIYVGDGLNDCMAITSSSVGVSVHSSLEQTFKVSDVHLMKPGVSKVLDLISSSKRLYMLLRINLTISFIYNITFGTLALMGLITPFLTAIIMPISSFFVVGLTFFMLKEY